MKKIVFSLSVIGVVGIFTVGATVAYFSATETSTGNVFAAGDLTIVLDGQNNEENTVGNNKTFFKGGDMIPGETETAYIEVKNDSDHDMIFGFTANNVNSDPSSFMDQLQVQVTLNPNDYTKELTGSKYGPSAGEVIVEFDDGLTIRDIKDGWLHNIEASFEEDYPLEPGYVAVYKVEVKMPFEVNDNYQGSELTADLEVKGVQKEGWTDKSHVYNELGW